MSGSRTKSTMIGLVLPRTTRRASIERPHKKKTHQAVGFLFVEERGLCLLLLCGLLSSLLSCLLRLLLCCHIVGTN